MPVSRGSWRLCSWQYRTKSAAVKEICWDKSGLSGNDVIIKMADFGLSAAKEAILKPSCALPEGIPKIKGYDFNQGVDLQAVLNSYITTGFQASSLGLAVQEINLMIEKRLEPVEEDEGNGSDEHRSKSGCTIFLGYTSNLISSGVRESIRYLVEHKMVDVVVSTAGGIEEDFIKCMAHTYLGEFSMSGAELREKGINRIGNLLVPNDNYCKFEDWLMPILDQMLLEQNTEGARWTPSKMIHRLGKEINNPDSVYYWAYKAAALWRQNLTTVNMADTHCSHCFSVTLISLSSGFGPESRRGARRDGGQEDGASVPERRLKVG
ncbi:Deoxyhypusine synthase [Liparis tanakae]|uniref:Deoxyhypusine synthase n=1 Tax=Liparis tanakae TaxID=230148 RepID=A0A4Z2IRW1_9TELE|nr:Deoxyhypusine synthase [Liparis tanakae]